MGHYRGEMVFDDCELEKGGHTYAVEMLAHFECGECKCWFSISDPLNIKTRVWTCPHCGHESKAEEK